MKKLNLPLSLRTLRGLIASSTLIHIVSAQAVNAAVIDPWINEIHYDNTGADSNEFVEIAGQAGIDLFGFSIVFYNGNNGASYGTIAASGTIPDQQNGFGTLSFTHSPIQNGAPDGIALLDSNDNVIQFLSYEGTFSIVDPHGASVTSTDIGVSESGSTGSHESLQLTGEFPNFSWNSPQEHSQGAVNPGQSFLNLIGTGQPVDDTGSTAVIFLASLLGLVCVQRKFNFGG